jgi:hypothetical protein
MWQGGPSGRFPFFLTSSLQGNGRKLSQVVIASAAKQSLFCWRLLRRFAPRNDRDAPNLEAVWEKNCWYCQGRKL